MGIVGILALIAIRSRTALRGAALLFAQHGTPYAWLSRRWLTRSAPLGWHRMTRSMVKQRAIAALAT